MKTIKTQFIEIELNYINFPSENLIYKQKYKSTSFNKKIYSCKIRNKRPSLLRNSNNFQFMEISISDKLDQAKFKSKLLPRQSILLTESLLMVDIGKLNQTLSEAYKVMEKWSKQEVHKESILLAKKFHSAQLMEHGLNIQLQMSQTVGL